MRNITAELLHLITSTSNLRQDLSLRAARKSDFSALHSNCYPDRPLSQFRESFERSLRRQSRGSCLHLIAEKGGDIVGSGQLVGYRHQKVAEIADLSVASAHRGSGIGTALIHVLTKLAEHVDYLHLEIGVMAGNTQALALYRRLGFEQAREIRLPGEARALILRKELPRQDGSAQVARWRRGNGHD